MSAQIFVLLGLLWLGGMIVWIGAHREQIRSALSTKSGQSTPRYFYQFGLMFCGAVGIFALMLLFGVK